MKSLLVLIALFSATSSFAGVHYVKLPLSAAEVTVTSVSMNYAPVFGPCESSAPCPIDGFDPSIAVVTLYYNANEFQGAQLKAVEKGDVSMFNVVFDKAASNAGTLAVRVLN